MWKLLHQLVLNMFFLLRKEICWLFVVSNITILNWASGAAILWIYTAAQTWKNLFILLWAHQKPLIKYLIILTDTL